MTIAGDAGASGQAAGWRAPGSRKRSRLARPAVEWPTVALLVLVYGGWLALTWWHAVLPLWVLVPAGAVLLAWHSSLQHEILHGHPTRWRWLNNALGSVPLSLWLPFRSYKISHLVHHRDERLTDPLDDPESRYWHPEDWQALGRLGQILVRAQTTLLGRMLLGPAWTIGRYWIAEARAAIANDRATRRIWVAHLAHMAPVLIWIVLICQMNLAFYCCALVYPGTAILLIRSFAEHRASQGVFERTAIVENSWLLGPLFLFNNLHAAHHALPDMPWYQIPAWYRANRERLIADNGGLVYNSYFDVARRFGLTPYDHPRHPHGRAPFADGRLPEDSARPGPAATGTEVPRSG